MGLSLMISPNGRDPWAKDLSIRVYNDGMRMMRIFH